MTALLERPRTLADAPDHVAMGTTPDVLTRITDEAINLAVWERRHVPPIADALGVADLTGLSRYDAAGTPEMVGSGLAEYLTRSGLPRPLVAALAADAVDLATWFIRIMASDQVALRLERITGDACRRFHADYMSVRLITTCRGAGTEWLAHADAARVIEGHAPDDAIIHHLAAGSVAMMKGRLWSEDHPLIHRSPPIAASGQDRLVMVIDVPPARGEAN